MTHRQDGAEPAWETSEGAGCSEYDGMKRQYDSIITREKNPALKMLAILQRVAAFNFLDTLDATPNPKAREVYTQLMVDVQLAIKDALLLSSHRAPEKQRAAMTTEAAGPGLREVLEVMKAREAAATKGPWRRLLNKVLAYKEHVICDLASTMGKYEPEEANAEFIAHARQDVPDLIAEVERLRAALAE